MRLKKIELQGFKSFAGKTEIVFLDGITTIVGPNGSGKSNISDSIKWVLGEQSAKSLRGSKMEDVIFAGTENRKKLGFAEVSIYIDNQDRTLPVEYSEVVVTRRVYRDGESNYLINGNECRLKDVQELFMDTGIGKDGYSIIGQGKIDELLSSKSEERRAVFEEASGITKYRTRKVEAVNKLTRTQADLSRIGDILGEIEYSLNPLEEKSKKAKIYLTLKEKLKVQEVNQFIRDTKESSEKLASLESSISQLQHEINLEEIDALNIEKAKLNLKERSEEIFIKIEQNQTKYYELQNSLEKLNSKKEVNTSSIQNAAAQLERLDQELVEDSNKIVSLQSDIKGKLDKQELLRQNKGTFEIELKQKESELQEILKKLDDRGIEIENLKKSIEQLEEQKVQLSILNSSLETKIELHEKQCSTMEKGVQSYHLEQDHFMLEKQKIVSDLNEKVGCIKQIEDKLKESNDQYTSSKISLDELLSKQQHVKEEQMRLSSKYKYLSDLEKENEGYFKSVKNILDYAKGNPNVYGTVSSVISTSEKYEKAIEVALGNFIQNVIVQNENIAKDMIGYLKENLLGRVTFLPLSNMRAVKQEVSDKVKSMPGYLDIAEHVCQYDIKFKNVIDLALNRCVIVDNLEHANAMYATIKEGIRIVTLDGEIISHNGSITGGNTSRNTSGLIGREAKILLLKKELEQKEAEYAKIEIQYGEMLNKVTRFADELEGLDKQREQLNLEQNTFQMRLENVKESMEKLKESNDKAAITKQELFLENEQNKVIIEQNNKNIQEIEKRILALDKEVLEYARINKQEQTTIDFLKEDVVNLKISLSSFDESSSSINEIKEKLEQDIENFKAAIRKKQNQKDILNTSIREFEKEIEQAQLERQELESFNKEYLQITDTLKQDKKECSIKMDALEIKMLESVNKIAKIREEINRTENKKIKFDLDIENAKNAMWEDYELTISSAKEFLERGNIVEEKSLLKEIMHLKNKIKELGEVDVGTIEEYKVQKERYDFMFLQKKDLDETKAKLENLIDNMTTLMKTEFTKQFYKINENFKETFTELFGGGRASLTLTDSSNVLESGIEIEVQPPGKKLQSMSLLSGGEKALTATALLFAILNIKAPPFCILDEIEAALDDVNVDRFAKYISKYSKETQFVVITHRKGTMEVAETVYGVTMEEHGISKVVSMKLR